MTFIPDLAAEIEIPTDGILSRVLYRDHRIRLVGFGFDRGQELTEHTANRAAVVQVVTGRLQVTVEGRTHELGPTSWLLIPADAPHSVTAAEPTVMLLTLIADRQGGGPTPAPSSTPAAEALGRPRTS